MIQIVNNNKKKKNKLEYFDFFFIIDTEIELTYHNGTIRDLIFMQDDSILLSGGAGDCKIYVTDIKKQVPIKSYGGHQGKEGHKINLIE
jgi:WD40 repeat protein